MRILIILLFSMNLMAQESSDRLTQLERRLDDIELNQALSKLKFSGSFMNHAESYYANKTKTDLYANNATLNGTASGINSYRDEQLNLMLMRVALNFDVQINQNVQFYSTIGMSKFWNVSGRDARSGLASDTYNSLSGGYALRDDVARFDTAYVQYHNPDSAWTLAMGRMTTNNGPPQNQLDGISRGGTYPFLTYNVIFDGAALIYKVKGMQRDRSLKFRLFYTPFLEVDNSNKTQQLQDGSDNSSNQEQIDSNNDFFTLLAEYSLEDLSWVRKLDIYYSLVNVEGIYESTQQRKKDDYDLDGDGPGVATCGNIAGTANYDRLCGDGVETASLTANTLYLGLDGIANSTYSLSYTYNQYKIRNTGIDEEDGRNMLYTLNKKFDNAWNGGDIIGVEYVITDENHPPVDGATLYINDFYNMTNGSGYHLFYTARMGATQLLRVGYMNYFEEDADTYFKNFETQTNATYVRWKVFF